MITLCAFCATAHKGFDTGNCHICRNQLESIDEWIEKGIESLEGKEFSLSTKIPSEWLVKEEEVLDCKIDKAASIKQAVNRHIISIMAKKGKKYNADGHVRLVFDFFHGIIQTEREPLFFFGRYKKYALLSQTRWVCSTCNGNGCSDCKSKGKFYESIEEQIGEVFKKHMNAENYYMHSSGREDVDALNTAGRPFVLEIKNPENADVDIEAVVAEINSAGLVKVEDMKTASRNCVALVTDSHFDKSYEAEVTFDSLDEDALRRLEGSVPLWLDQRTPNRVAHRRADLVRKRAVLSIKMLELNGNKARLDITAEAGTYIKEFISGDEGRTTPNISSLLGTKAKCERLTVTRIYDDFLRMNGL